MKRNRIGRLAGVAIAVAVALPAVAVAGHQDSGVASYTGCTTGGGGITNLAAGDAPAKPCAPNQTEVHLGGGDITAVEAGSGLTGGATDGKAILAVDPSAVWLQGGNAGTTPGTDFLGTTDDRALEFRVNGARAFRLEPGLSPNVVGGAAFNSTGPFVVGATIAGGGCPVSNDCGSDQPNQVTGDFGTVGGGAGNTASDLSTVAGGFLNSTSGFSATVGGGFQNSAISSQTTVGGGRGNTASGPSATVAGGASNTASGSIATVAGGAANSAAGRGSFAAGHRAKANHDGAFVWADNVFDFGSAVEFHSVGNNEFAARATGGVRFVTAVDAAGNPTTTCGAAGGGAVWACTSDRATKTDFARVSGKAVLQRLAGLPIAKWRFRGEDASVRHLGPVAQDFRSAFGLGADAKQIAFTDLAGVALNAAKALYRMVTSHDERIDALERALDRQKRRADRLESRLDRLEKTVAKLAR